MKTSIPRLRRIRFKDGRTIEVLRQPEKSKATQAIFEKSSVFLLESEIGKDMAGFALVAWTRGGNVYVNYDNRQESPILSGQVPQYVKDVLLAEVAVRWSHE